MKSFFIYSEFFAAPSEVLMGGTQLAFCKLSKNPKYRKTKQTKMRRMYGAPFKYSYFTAKKTAFFLAISSWGEIGSSPLRCYYY
ncbi:MAG: hypothetical protein EAZ14_02815 [Runella slithyformis]|nr:MAG: hypothetical protein EAZ14_02815 [Runella slithyformis]